MPYLDSDLVFDSLKRCTSCLLPDSFPGISFDEEGVCNYCHEQPPFEEYGEDAFVELLQPSPETTIVSLPVEVEVQDITQLRVLPEIVRAFPKAN